MLNVSQVEVTSSHVETSSTVSRVELPQEGVVVIKVHHATGHKCARCWNFMPEVSTYGIWENVCTRCQGALAEMGIEPPVEATL
jgi:isoleucyl-tRNA synthetase